MVARYQPRRPYPGGSKPVCHPRPPARGTTHAPGAHALTGVILAGETPAYSKAQFTKDLFMTNPKAWLLLIPAVLVEVTASLALKGALEHPALYFVVVIGYLSGFVLLSAILRTGMALGVAYGIWAATGVALTAVGSLLIFEEPITTLMGIGIVVIIGGVLCVELGAQAAHKKPMIA